MVKSPPSIKRERDFKWVPLKKVVRNERNPRQQASFAPESLAALKASVEEHGIIEPLIVQDYDDDMFMLIEGERRYRVAESLEMKDIPVMVVNRQDEQDQVILMFNIHHQRKGWEMAEELTAIKELVERNGHVGEDEIAKRLGISTATLRDRLQVLAMGDKVVQDIARDKLDYSSALRSDQLAKSIAKKRPDVAAKLGGEKGVQSRLLDKARSRRPSGGRGGISQELVEARKDLVDPDAMPDELVEEYLERPDAKLSDVRQKAQSLEERRKVEGIAKEVRRLDRDLTLFRVDLAAAPNLKELRNALAGLILTAQTLERRVSDVMHDQEEDPGR